MEWGPWGFVGGEKAQVGPHLFWYLGSRMMRPPSQGWSAVCFLSGKVIEEQHGFPNKEEARLWAELREDFRCRTTRKTVWDLLLSED